VEVAISQCSSDSMGRTVMLVRCIVSSLSLGRFYG
jgi:hypothetical protein